MAEQGIKPEVKSFIELFGLSVEYCKNTWDTAIDLYELWRLGKFAALKRTHSRIAIHLHHSMVQERAPKILNNAWGDRNLVSLIPRTPEAELFVRMNELWLRNILSMNLNLPFEGISTVEQALVCGTAYRMPKVSYTKKNGKMVPIIGSQSIDFFSFLPAPMSGGHVNPFNKEQQNALPYGFFIDWMREDFIEGMAKKGTFDEDQTRRMLSKDAKTENWPEETYRGRFDRANSINYGGPQQWQTRMNAGAPYVGKKRRVVHWYTREKHYIIGEDAYLIYAGPPELTDEFGRGIIPVTRYVTCPDFDNFYGIPFLRVIDDVLRALVMNVNLRFDNLLASIYPQTWIRDDLLQGKPLSAFRRSPYAMHSFPQSVQDIQKAVFYDYGKDVPQQSFLDEDRIKALLQKVAGATETTSSLQDVVGNKTATGVTAIMNELMGRPMMESMAFELGGFRDECKLLIHLGEKFEKDNRFIRVPQSEDGFPWTELDPDLLSADYDIETRGTRFLQERNVQFQKLMAFFPWVNQNPMWDQYELHKQASEVAEFIPHPERALLPPAAMGLPAAGGSPPAAAGQPGGAASPMDLNQQAENVEVPAGAAF